MTDSSRFADTFLALRLPNGEYQRLPGTVTLTAHSPAPMLSPALSLSGTFGVSAAFKVNRRSFRRMLRLMRPRRTPAQGALARARDRARPRVWVTWESLHPHLTDPRCREWQGWPRRPLPDLVQVPRHVARLILGRS